MDSKWREKKEKALNGGKVFTLIHKMLTIILSLTVYAQYYLFLLFFFVFYFSLNTMNFIKYHALFELRIAVGDSYQIVNFHKKKKVVTLFKHNEWRGKILFYFSPREENYANGTK